MQVGQSLQRGSDAFEVAQAAARESIEPLDGLRPQLIMVFCTDAYDPQAVVAGVRSVVGNAPLAGCQAPGVLACDEVSHDGVGVLALGGTQLQARTHMVGNVAEQPERSGAAAVAGALELDAVDVDAQCRALVVIADAIAGNACAVVRGVSNELGTTVRVVGGGAGDSLKFQSTHLFAGGNASSNAVLGLGLRSATPIGIGIEHGCHPWGPPMTITRSEGKELKELEWTPAYEHYVDVVSSLDGRRISAEEFIQYALLHPFGIAQANDHYVLRSPFQPGPQGQIYCCSELPRDGVLRIMLGDRASLLEAAYNAAARAARDLGEHEPGVGLVFSCVSRDLVFGAQCGDATQELATIRRGLGGDVPLFGCLSYGQIGTIGDGLPQFHSKAVQVCALAA